MESEVRREGSSKFEFRCLFVIKLAHRIASIPKSMSEEAIGLGTASASSGGARGVDDDSCPMARSLLGARRRRAPI